MFINEPKIETKDIQITYKFLYLFHFLFTFVQTTRKTITLQEINYKMHKNITIYKHAITLCGRMQHLFQSPIFPNFLGL